MCVPDDDVVARGHQARRGDRLRAGVAVRHAAAEPGRVDVAGAGRRAHVADRPRPRRAGAEPAPPDDERGRHGDARRAGPGTGRGLVRHRVHRPPGDGLPRDPVVVHDRLHRRLLRSAARRGRRVGGRPHADAAPRRQRAGPPDRRPGPDRRPRTEGSGRRRATTTACSPRRSLDGLEPGAFDWVAYLYWGTVLDEGEDARRRAGARRRRARWRPGLPRHLRARTAATPCPTSPAGRSGSPSSTSGARTSATSTSTSATASTSTPPTGPLGGHRRVRCSRRRRSPARADEVQARIDELGEQGVTEVVFQPCGPDIRRELEAMFAAAGG